MHSKWSIDTNSIAMKLILLFLLFFIINNFQTAGLQETKKAKPKCINFSQWIKTYQFLETPTGNASSRDSNCLNPKAFQEPTRALPWTYWEAYSAPRPLAAICNNQLHLFHIRDKDFFSLRSIRDSNIFDTFSIRDKDFFAPPFDRFPVLYPP